MAFYHTDGGLDYRIRLLRHTLLPRQVGSLPKVAYAKTDKLVTYHTGTATSAWQQLNGWHAAIPCSSAGSQTVLQRSFFTITPTLRLQGMAGASSSERALQDQRVWEAAARCQLVAGKLTLAAE